MFFKYYDKRIINSLFKFIFLNSHQDKTVVKSLWQNKRQLNSQVIAVGTESRKITLFFPSPTFKSASFLK